MALTAHKWELANATDILEWMEASGVKERLLSDICMAVKQCVYTTNRSESSFRYETIKQYPDALAKCDDIDFNDRAQAVAYLALHMADRYCRTWLVLEQVLAAGKLPIGKSGNFSVLDVGSGPGPGVFAVRHFYAALAHYAKLHNSQFKVEVVGRIGIVERSYGMASVMHHFAESLLMIERGDAPTRKRNPCFDELITSSISFHSGHQDFENFNFEDMHIAPRYWITASEEAPTEDQEETHAASRRTPTAYSLILMVNFLTTEQMTKQFDGALDKLMCRGLTPGGIILCIGARKEVEEYRRIYDKIDQKAHDANLRKVESLDDPLKADEPQYVPKMLSQLCHEIWRYLSVDNDTTDVEASLKKMGCEDIFNPNVNFDLPFFSAHVYRRGA